MNIHADKVEHAPPHAITLRDVRTILAQIPPGWTEGLIEVRLANSLEHHSPWAFFSHYDGCLTIYSRRGTREQAVVATLSALAAATLNIKMAVGRRVSTADTERLEHYIQPYVLQILAEMAENHKVGSDVRIAWQPMVFPNNKP